VEKREDKWTEYGKAERENWEKGTNDVEAKRGDWKGKRCEVKRIVAELMTNNLAMKNAGLIPPRSTIILTIILYGRVVNGLSLFKINVGKAQSDTISLRADPNRYSRF
jgi:hypothetical protein